MSAKARLRAARQGSQGVIGRKEVPRKLRTSYERFMSLEFREGVWAGDTHLGIICLQIRSYWKNREMRRKEQGRLRRRHLEAERKVGACAVLEVQERKRFKGEMVNYCTSTVLGKTRTENGLLGGMSSFGTWTTSHQVLVILSPSYLSNQPWCWASSLFQDPIFCCAQIASTP